MSVVMNGAWVEPKRYSTMQKIVDQNRDGAHYSVWHMDVGPDGRPNGEAGMASLRELFPTGEANDLNFVLFSTSGVHGTYAMLEEIEASLKKYGDDYEPPDGDYPDDWCESLTVLIVQPRIVCIRCGNVKVRKADLRFLKKLRRTSAKAMASIGRPA